MVTYYIGNIREKRFLFRKYKTRAAVADNCDVLAHFKLNGKVCFVLGDIPYGDMRVGEYLAYARALKTRLPLTDAAAAALLKRAGVRVGGAQAHARIAARGVPRRFVGGGGRRRYAVGLAQLRRCALFVEGARPCAGHGAPHGTAIRRGARGRFRLSLYPAQSERHGGGEQRDVVRAGKVGLAPLRAVAVCPLQAQGKPCFGRVERQKNVAVR